jgi:ABC-2 type transporter.
MKTIFALLIKQCKDSLRNLPSLMILIIYPAVAFIMITAMKGEENMDGFFVPMFAAMHCSFAPLVISSNILSEEKEKGTLRSLLMAGVTRVKYLISLSVFVLVSVLLTGSAFLLMKDFGLRDAGEFAAAMLLGSVVSTLIGLCIGIYAKNVTAANGMAVPVGLVFALLPMLGQFNGTLAKVSDCTYSGRLRTVFEGGGFTATTLLVPGVYFVALSVLLLLLFRRKGME